MKTINDVPKGIVRKTFNFIGLFYNITISHVPSRRIRTLFYRLSGAKISRNSLIFRNVDLLWPMGLEMREGSSIGWHCTIDARGGIVIGSEVTVASKCNLITGSHDLKDKYFPPRFEKIVIDDYAWVCTNSMILQGVHIGRGAVVCAGAVVTRDVEPMTVVAGIPAKVIGYRDIEPEYENGLPPLLH